MSESLIHNLAFDDRGLITAIVQDDETNEVLMTAYMNAESLARTLQTGETCDGDALLVRVNPNGPACHTGERTCFFRGKQEMSGSEFKEKETDVKSNPKVESAPSPLSLVNVAAMDLGILLQDLYKLIQERKDQRPEGSYTSYLFNSGLDKILKKVGEESAETIIAAKNADLEDGRTRLTSEISDLLYHLLVLMVEREVSLQDILNELNDRAGKPASPKTINK
jgi:phosphoribosyl-ATP pyrophosphohydrolase/phosphoribosyl-AMP cyclohydrolase